MIVVINPSNASGHSFKGLHAYCAHDQESTHTAERVDWVDMRNIACNDPGQAWKLMAITAQSQNALKQSAGVRAGRASKHGPVMHVVMSFDKDEPHDKKAMKDAADALLSKLGADPSKMRGKSKPGVKQFADEHQVVMYAHNDTDNPHLHLMINRVHPEHGRNLPSSNDQLKAQKWALEYSKEHGTDHKTPARSENMAERDSGEYVKANRRKSRNIYEQEQTLLEHAKNDNAKMEALQGQQRKKDHALALRGRNLAALQSQEWHKASEAFKQRKLAIHRKLKRDINTLKSDIREEFRPRTRKLYEQQKAERQTFHALESSFFGKASNIVKTVRLSSSLIHGDESGIITRSFKILSNAGERKAYFDKSQEQAKQALLKEQRTQLSDRIKVLKDKTDEKVSLARAELAKDKAALMKKHEQELQALRDDWKARNQERKAFYEEALQKQKLRDELTGQFKSAAPDAKPDEAKRILSDSYIKAVLDDSGYGERSNGVSNDNERDRGDDGHER